MDFQRNYSSTVGIILHVFFLFSANVKTIVTHIKSNSNPFHILSFNLHIWSNNFHIYGNHVHIYVTTLFRICGHVPRHYVIFKRPVYTFQIWCIIHECLVQSVPWRMYPDGGLGQRGMATRVILSTTVWGYMSHRYTIHMILLLNLYFSTNFIIGIHLYYIYTYTFFKTRFFVGISFLLNNFSNCYIVDCYTSDHLRNLYFLTNVLIDTPLIVTPVINEIEPCVWPVK